MYDGVEQPQNATRGGAIHGIESGGAPDESYTGLKSFLLENARAPACLPLFLDLTGTLSPILCRQEFL